MTTRPGDDAHPRMTVILGPFSSEPFALGMRNLLFDSGDFDVVAIEDIATLGREAILIIEGSDPAVCLTYLDMSVVRYVVLFDPAGARAFVGLDNPDWLQLATVIRSAAAEMSAMPSAAVHGRVRLVDPRRLTPASGADSAALYPLLTWLDLRFGLAVRHRLGRDVTGVPGWSIAPSEAMELLGLDPGTTEQELTSRLRTADDALVVTRAALPGALARIADTFALSDLELRMLCLVLAPELDGRYGTVVGVLRDDLTHRRPGLTLLAELMRSAEVDPWNLRRAVSATNSIVADGLVRPAGTDDLAVDVGLAPGRAVVLYLLISEEERAVAEVGAVLHLPRPPDEVPLSAEEYAIARRLRRAVTESSPLIHLVGGGPGRAWFGRVAASIGLPLVVGNLAAVDPGPARAAAVIDWHVLSRLTGSGLLVLGANGTDDSAIDARLSRIAGRAVLVATDLSPAAGASSEPRVLLSAPYVSAAQRAAWWDRVATRAGLSLDAGDLERLAATVPVDGEHISRTVSVAAGQATDSASSDAQLVRQASRDLLASAVPPGVHRVVPAYGWDDIVLPELKKELLRSIAEHVVHAGRVLEQWGFAGRMPYGQGVAVLFSGPSGTGKTMAAQIIAGELGVDLFQVDLSKTISKYIGETEKNLDGIFEAAERTGAVLLFDEADAIFGKRTEIKDAHDRHANVEVAYLLQRVESFRGLAVLTTNVKQNIDDAFVRRLRFALDFPMPNAAERARIWRRAFPARAPLAPEVDVAHLASRLQITGGSIQNIALHAAFLAAAGDGAVTAAHILASARRELVKIGMLTAERSLDERSLGVVS